MKKWNVQGKLNSSDNVIDILLKNREISNTEEFLNPPNVQYWLKKLPADFKTSLKGAQQIISKAIGDGFPIVVYGDYDADGVCATAILFKVISSELNYNNVFSFIPNRFDHGYGLSKESIDDVVKLIKEKQGDFERALMITVDTGITAVEEIEYAKENGFDVILTDHHQKPEIVPNADCIVWNDSVVGSTVAWLLGKVLGSKDKQSIALAATATVTDLHPIMELNRTIVKEGLRVLNEDPPVGLKELLAVSGQQGKEITTYQLGWVIGPRLNATGRLIDASTSLNLLLSPTSAKAYEIAEKLNEINTQRQDKTMEMYELAANIDEDSPPKIIVSSHEDYHEGIIGLVASKLVQKHYRPSIVISLTDGYGKGSVRSVKGVNIIEILRNYDDLFESLGGHPMAAGFSIPKENINKLRAFLLDYAEDNIPDELLVPVLDIDLEIPLDLIDFDFYEELLKLKPFGIGNKEPVFASKNVGVTGKRVVGRNQTHLSLNLFFGNQTYKAIYFNGAEHADSITEGEEIDIAYTLSKNEFRNNVSIDLIIKDIHV